MRSLLPLRKDTVYYELSTIEKSEFSGGSEEERKGKKRVKKVLRSSEKFVVK